MNNYHKKIIIITIYSIFFHTQIINSFFDDSFEKDFIEKINALEENSPPPSANLHSKSFENAPSHINTQQCSTSFYQQNTNSLTLTNKEKTVKITEKKSNEQIIYIIDITNHMPQLQVINKSENQEADHIIELKNLQKYVKKSFSSKPAITKLQECIDGVNKENKVDVSNNANQTIYTIEIISKKESVETNSSRKKSKKRKRRK